MRTPARAAVIAALSLATAAGCGLDATATPVESVASPTPPASAEASMDADPGAGVVSFDGTVPAGWTASGPGAIPVLDSEGETRSFEVLVNQSVMAADCTLGPEPGVGLAAGSIVDAIGDRVGISVNDQGTMTVDGRPAEWIDFAASEATCPPGEADGYVPLFGTFDAENYWLFTGAAPGEAHRLIAVELDVGNLLIWTYAVEPSSIEDQLEAAMQVVEGLVITAPRRSR